MKAPQRRAKPVVPLEPVKSWKANEPPETSIIPKIDDTEINVIPKTNLTWNLVAACKPTTSLAPVVNTITNAQRKSEAVSSKPVPNGPSKTGACSPKSVKANVTPKSNLPWSLVAVREPTTSPIPVSITKTNAPLKTSAAPYKPITTSNDPKTNLPWNVVAAGKATHFPGPVLTTKLHVPHKASFRRKTPVPLKSVDPSNPVSKDEVDGISSNVQPVSTSAATELKKNDGGKRVPIENSTRQRSVTVFGNVDRGIWLKLFLPMLSIEDRAALAASCLDGHDLVNNYCARLVPVGVQSKSRFGSKNYSWGLKTIALDLGQDKIFTAKRTEVPSTQRIAVASMNSDYSASQLVSGMSFITGFTTLRRVEFNRTRLLSNTMATRMILRLPMCNVWVFNGCDGIIPSDLFDWMISNQPILRTTKVLYTPSGIGMFDRAFSIFRSWEGKRQWYWAALLVAYAPFFAQVVPYMIDMDTRFMQLVLDLFSNSRTRNDVGDALVSLFEEAEKMSRFTLFTPGNSDDACTVIYGDEDDDPYAPGSDWDDYDDGMPDDATLEERNMFIDRAKTHSYFHAADRLTMAIHQKTAIVSADRMSNRNSQGRKLHPCDAHGPLPGRMLEGQNLQHDKQKLNRCMICTVCEDWGLYLNHHKSEHREAEDLFWKERRGGEES